MNEFPEFVGGSEGGDIPPHVMAVMGRMFDMDSPDSREYEWMNVAEPKSERERAQSLIRSYLNDGFSLLQLFTVEGGIIYWQGARERKPEG